MSSKDSNGNRRKSVAYDLVASLLVFKFVRLYREHLAPFRRGEAERGSHCSSARGSPVDWLDDLHTDLRIGMFPLPEGSQVVVWPQNGSSQLERWSACAQGSPFPMSFNRPPFSSRNSATIVQSDESNSLSLGPVVDN